MLLGVIADDFTGASDIANTLARGGMATTQFLGLPKRDAPPSCEAGVVALKTRSIDAPAAVAQSLAAFSWLKAHGCRQFVFKYCSTFDSTPAGNIGPVGERLADALDARGVVACPAFPAAGRTVFQGHLFVGDRLLSESSLRHHPLNPMTDADLRRWLRQQTADEVGLVTHATVRRGAGAIAAALLECAARNEKLVIVDAIDERDLVAIGEACADAPLVTGGSGVALGLPANFARKGLLKGSASAARRATGPAAILAGSCSARTLEQVGRYRETHPSMGVDPVAIMERRVTARDAVAFVKSEGNSPLVFTTAPPERVAEAQGRFGREKVACEIEGFFAETAAGLVRSGVRTLVVAGGETSGAVVTALELDAVDIGPEIDPGVPVLHAGGVTLVLKSGNFGGLDFFQKALDAMQIRPS